MMRRVMLLLAVACFPAVASAQPFQRLPSGCGTAPTGAGNSQPYLDNNGNLCVSSAGGAGSSGTITPAGTNGTTAQAVQGINGGVPEATKPGPVTIVPLDVSTVTTGGTAVTALAAGHRTAGGFLQNPIGATVSLCVNEQGTATGTTSAGATTCVAPGNSYTLVPAANAVSVITSDSAHPFSGEGLN